MLNDILIDLEPIFTEWGNAAEKRLVRPYDSITERDSENPTPENGEVCFVASNATVFVYITGQGWLPVGEPVGAGKLWFTNTAPHGYVFAQGQEVLRASFPLLSTLWGGAGYPYGAGNGTTTFRIPDLRQRFPMGRAGSGTGNALGQTFGLINHNHTVDPPSTNTTSNGHHTHGTQTSNDTQTAVGRASGASDTSRKGHTHNITADGAHIHALNIAPFNSGTNNPPTLVVQYIIRAI